MRVGGDNRGCRSEMSRFVDMAEFGESARFLRLTNLEQLAAKAQAFDGTKRVWMLDEAEAYIEVEIKELNGDKTTVGTKDGRLAIQSLKPNTGRGKQLHSRQFHSYTRSELKRGEAEERQVVLVQEKNDLALQLQARMLLENRVK
ncbi:hypothetical protein PAMP_011549 [Pampus punctatissimus]